MNADKRMGNICVFAVGLVVVFNVVLWGEPLNAQPKKTNQTRSEQNEVKILESWQGDYPVAQLRLLPEKQHEQGVGYIGDANTFEGVWKAFKPGEAVERSRKGSDHAK